MATATVATSKAAVGHPPDDIPAARLFRLLLATPRPVVSITTRLAGCNGRLSVRALLSREVAMAHDEATQLSLSPEVHERYVRERLVEEALLIDGQRCTDPGDWTDPVWDVASALVLRELGRMSPILGRCDSVAWHVRLCEGAKAPENAIATRALGGCYSAVVGLKHARFIDRPDRFFGLPLSEMTDGHWLCYHAARAVVEERYV